MYTEINVSNPPISRVSNTISWPVSRAFRPLTLKHNGREYRVRIYLRDKHYTAIAKVHGRLVESAEASSEIVALARLVKALDPAAGIIRDKGGRLLAQ